MMSRCRNCGSGSDDLVTYPAEHPDEPDVVHCYACGDDHPVRTSPDSGEGE